MIVFKAGKSFKKKERMLLKKHPFFMRSIVLKAAEIYSAQLLLKSF
jgi:hypothetical protein